MGLNGNGGMASIWGEVVGQLTGRTDLHLLTLARLVGDLFPRRQLRQTPAWCPACLSEWRIQGKPLYQPLLWMVQLVTMCPHHRTLLVDRCPRCNQRQKVLVTKKTLPFECTSCAHWLGGEPDRLCEGEDRAELIAWQAWVISALEELHATSLEASMLQWEPFFTNLAGYLKKRRAHAKLAQIVGRGRENFHRWVTEGVTEGDTTLETIFTFCYRCEVTPLQVMNGHLEPLERIIREGTRRSFPLPRRKMQRFDREHCHKQLYALLSETKEEPLGLNQVAQRLRCDTTYLWKYFPEESALILQRAKAYRKLRKEQREARMREEIRQAVFSLHAQGEYPLRYKLSAFFPNGLMRLPEAIEAWRAALRELGLEP